MKHAILLSGIAAVALSSLGSAAFAQTAPSTTPPAGSAQNAPAVSPMDIDGDGTVTQEEIQARAAERFAAADTDGDGVVTAEELVALMQSQQQAREETRMQRRAEAMIQRMDRDQDGSLSAEEMTPADHRAEMFERIDADGDGMISQEEFATLREDMQGRRGDAFRGLGFRDQGRQMRGEGDFRMGPRMAMGGHGKWSGQANGQARGMAPCMMPRQMAMHQMRDDHAHGGRFGQPLFGQPRGGLVPPAPQDGAAMQPVPPADEAEPVDSGN